MFIAICLALGMVQAKPAKMSDESMLRAAISRIDKSYAQHDLSVVESYMAPEYVSTNAIGETGDRKKVLASLKELFAPSRPLAMTTKISKVDIKGPEATLSLLITLNTSFTDARGPHKNRIEVSQTQIWKKKNSTWFIVRSKVHRQRSYVDDKLEFDSMKSKPGK